MCFIWPPMMATEALWPIRLEDHANNLVTTLKLYEQIEKFSLMRKLYMTSGCTLAPQEYLRPCSGHDERWSGTAQSPIVPDQISKVVGEFYSVYTIISTNCPPSAQEFHERLRSQERNPGGWSLAWDPCRWCGEM